MHTFSPPLSVISWCSAFGRAPNKKENKASTKLLAQQKFKKKAQGNRDSSDHFLNVSLVVNNVQFLCNNRNVFGLYLETFFLPGHHPFTTTRSRFEFAAKILFKIFVHSRVNNTLLSQGPRVGG